MSRSRSFLTMLDWSILIFPVIISTIGLSVLYSAGYDPESGQNNAFQKQIIYFAISIIIFFITAILSPQLLKRSSFFVYLVGILLLLFLVIKGGVVAGGAGRWLAFGPIRMQPSELMKVGLIMFLAKLFSSENSPKDGYYIKNLLKPALIMLLPAILILKEPDLGTALSVLAIGGTMLFTAGLRFRSLFKILIILIILAIPAYKFGLKEYQRQRVVTFLAPETDPLGKGYHSIQSKIAVGSGSIFGKGFRKGTQTQLRFLPEQTTDFVFSVLAEEWGFLGSFSVVALYLLFLNQLLSLSIKMEDRYSMYLIVGTTALIFWHMFINIGMVIGLLPVVGITLPIFSYGGSSLITTMLLLGMVAGLSSRRYMFT